MRADTSEAWSIRPRRFGKHEAAQAVHLLAVIEAGQVGETVREQAQAVFAGGLSVQQGLAPHGVDTEDKAPQITHFPALFRTIGEGQNIRRPGAPHMQAVEFGHVFVSRQHEFQRGIGGDDLIAAAREQWNDGSNTLCIAPGKIVVYQRNDVSNAILRDNGLTVLEMPSAELSRGRGGPRCMSMPLIRAE